MDGVMRSNVLYLKHTNLPYTGKSTCIWDSTNTIWYKGKYVNGKKEGLWRFYNEDGTKRSHISYISGKMEGERIIFGFNDKEIAKMTCKNNKCIQIK
tara:strand:- start:10164 stop:10454 length:291 start_codon:yes stop_codon:yes gene_type:complete